MGVRRYFGTDGIRGRVGGDKINAEFLLKLGWAFGCSLVETHTGSQPAKVIIGCDTRVSGPMIESALEAGLTAAGVNVRRLDVLPTPAIAHLTASLRADAGIVISASHNPYYDNGVKFFNAQGMKLSDEAELDIEAKMDKPMITVNSDNIGNSKFLPEIRMRYIAYCKTTFPAKLSLDGLKIVVDCANGATYDVAPHVFHELGAEVITIANTPDGFNINEKCGATHLALLQQRVLEHKADLGVALDGDGDRLMLVDHLGEVVDGDEVLCILAHDLNAQAANKPVGIVGTVMSNLGLEQSIKSIGMEFIRSKVGDRYVLEELANHQWTLGGESSGHIVNLDYATTGDGIISALQVLRVLQAAKTTLHAAKKVMTKCPQTLINVPAKGSKDISDYPEILEAVHLTEQQLQDQGRVLLRPSGTEPLIRVMVEGNDKQLVEAAAQQLADVVANAMAAPAG